MRKKVYQEELEEGLNEKESGKQQADERISALDAENKLLKEQLSYFQEIFATSSLSGHDPAKLAAKGVKLS
jgi:hypothetical protein